MWVSLTYIYFKIQIYIFFLHNGTLIKWFFCIVTLLRICYKESFFLQCFVAILWCSIANSIKPAVLNIEQNKLCGHFQQNSHEWKCKLRLILPLMQHQSKQNPSWSLLSVPWDDSLAHRHRSCTERVENKILHTQFSTSPKKTDDN